MISCSQRKCKTCEICNPKLLYIFICVLIGYDVGYLGVKTAIDALDGQTLEAFIASSATIETAENAEAHRVLVEAKSA